MSIDSPSFKYEFDVKRNGDTLTFDYTLLQRGTILEPKQIARFRKDVEGLKDANYWELDLTTPTNIFGAENAPENPNKTVRIWLLAQILALGCDLRLRLAPGAAC